MSPFAPTLLPLLRVRTVAGRKLVTVPELLARLDVESQEIRVRILLLYLAREILREIDIEIAANSTDTY